MVVMQEMSGTGGGLCPTLRTFQGGNAQPLIVVKNFNHKYNAR